MMSVDMDTEHTPSRLMDLTITGAAGVERPTNGPQIGGMGWVVMKADGSPITNQEGAPMATTDTQGGAPGATTSATGDTVTLTKAEHEALVAKAAKADTAMEPDGDDEKAKLAKALDALPEVVRKHLADTERRTAEAERIAKAAEAAAAVERDSRLAGEYVAKAAEFAGLPTTPDQLGPVLRSLDERLTPETAAEVRRLLKAAGETGAFAAIVQSYGTAGAAPAAGSAMDRINKAAATLRTTNPSLTPEQATTQVLSTDRELAAAYAAERG